MKNIIITMVILTSLTQKTIHFVDISDFFELSTQKISMVNS